MTKRIDPASLTPLIGTLYPSPFDEPFDLASIQYCSAC